MIALPIRSKGAYPPTAGSQQSAQLCGSTIGATPNATDSKASPIKMIEVHTLKAMSEEFRRLSLAVGGYKTVGENKVMSVSK